MSSAQKKKMIFKRRVLVLSGHGNTA